MRRSCSEAATSASRSPTRSPRTFPTCARAFCRGCLKAAQRNADRGFGDIALFEVGQCFASDEPEGQTTKAAAVRRGTARAEGVGRHWDGGAVAVDAFDAKADALALLTALGVPTGGLQVAPGGADWLHPGRSGTLRFGPQNPIGAFGEIHPKVLKAIDLKGPLVAFEITLDSLPLPKYRPTKMKPRLVAVRIPAGDARLRLRGRPRRGGGRYFESRAGGRALAHRRRRRVRRLRGSGHRGGQEIGRHRRHAAAASKRR